MIALQQIDAKHVAAQNLHLPSNEKSGNKNSHHNEGEHDLCDQSHHDADPGSQANLSGSFLVFLR
jgi:hypothetical protein